MNESELLVDVADRVMTLTINRPEKRNALSWDLIRDLRVAVAGACADPDVRVLVLTGAGDRAFCAGADLTTMADGARYAELHQARGELAHLFTDLWALGKPTIARVRGYALAGGFGLAMACDLVVAAEDAVFATPEIDVGLWPHMITVPLTRSMAPKVALELMMTGRRVDADEARRIGFVNRVVAAEGPGGLDDAVAALAATLAAKSAEAMRLGRDSFYGAWDLSAADALRMLHPMLTVTASTDDATEGLAAFADKRPPSWS